MDIKKKIGEIKLKSVTINEVPKKTSWVFKHFGYLCLKPDARSADVGKSITTDYFFCRPCLQKTSDIASADKNNDPSLAELL